MIFRDRPVDYYSFHSNREGKNTGADQKAIEQTLDFIRKDEYDLIVCYMTNYDSQMHRHGPYSEEAAEQAHLAAVRFEALKEEMDRSWKNYNRMLVFVPDHGGHCTDETHGGHGSDLREDMIVNHYYRISEKKQ